MIADDGSASNCSYGFSSFPNSGMYLAGAGSRVTLVSNGLQALQAIEAAGDVSVSLGINSGAAFNAERVRYKNDYAVSHARTNSIDISGGVLTADSNYIYVETEADAASDDLDTLTTTGNTINGSFVVLETPFGGARNVVIKDGTGNIHTKSGGDVTLNTNGAKFFGWYDSGGDLWEINHIT